MTRTILIQDPDPVTRTRVRARLQAEAFRVIVAEPDASVGDCAAAERAGLILIAGPEALDRVRALKGAEGRPASPVPVLLFGGPDTSAARFRALDAGADDVMPAPVCESLLLARVRSLMRRGPAVWATVGDGTGTSMPGFHEGRAGWVMAPRVVLLSPVPARSADLAADLQSALSHRVRLAPHLAVETRPDLVVIDARFGALGVAGLSGRLAGLRGAPGDTPPATLVVCDRTDLALAATAFDLGADDVVVGLVDPAELSQRASRLLASPIRAGVAGRAAARSRLADLTRGPGPFAAIRVRVPTGVALPPFETVPDVAAILRDGLRAADCVARLSEDRWLCLLPLPDAETATAVAARLEGRLVVAGVTATLGWHLFGQPEAPSLSRRTSVKRVRQADYNAA